MFTQKCFIRKNTSQLQNKLADIGYKFTCFPSGDVLVTENERSLAYIEELSNAPYYGIEEDCGTNEELFLAIAALRDDSDKNQWFTDGEYWNLCKEDDWAINEYKWAPNIYFHKATVSELINHFNK